MTVTHQTFGNMDNNCYLIVDEESNQSALVDCTEFSEKMLDLIGDTNLKYILLTHGHFDHIIGTKALKERFGAQIAISETDAPMLTSGKLSLAVFCGAKQNNVAPDILLHDGDVLPLGNTKIRVLATPGHTKGSVCFVAGDALFTGDTLFHTSCGRTDFPGGSWEEMQLSLRTLAALDGDYTVYPGHEALSTLSFERENNPYMK